MPYTYCKFTVYLLSSNALDMKAAKKKINYPDQLDEVPSQINDSQVLYLLKTKDVNWSYVDSLKSLIDYSDDVISEWLNISVRTFRSYKQPENKVKDNIKEHVLLLISVLKHGALVLGSKKELKKWLSTKNFHFDNSEPVNYLTTISGIRFIDERLTAIEYGDNV